MDKQLFKVGTHGCGDFHVIATSFDKAAKAVEEVLNSQDYGYSSDRRITRVESICQQVFMSNGKRALYGDGNVNHLIVSDDVDTELIERRCASIEEENFKLKCELEKANAKINDLQSLPIDGTTIPTIDEIKSVYAAAGVMEQMYEPTDAKRLNTLWEKLKKQHQEYGDNQ